MQECDALSQASRSLSGGSFRGGRRLSTCLAIGDEEETVSERIGKIGFGWYQLQCFGFCCGFIVAEAAELAMASGIARCVGEEFGIVSDFHLSMLMTTTFAGLALGTLLSGPMGDRLGRRVPMFVSSSGIPSAALLTYFAPSLSSVFCLRLAMGTFAGLGIPMAVVILSEVSPKQLRGISVATMGIAWCLGEFYAAVGLFYMAPDLQRGPWRWLVLWAAAPAMKLLVCGVLSPVTRYDTAHWLGAQGRADETVGALNLMARMNGRPELALGDCGKVSLRASAKTSGDSMEALAELSQQPLAVYTVAQAILCFAKDFALFGTGVLWPLAWADLHARFRLEAAGELMATALLGIPGVGLAMCIMHSLPRRAALGGAGVICAGACWALLSLRDGTWRGLAGVVLFKLFFPTWQMVTMLLPAEIFPTPIKSCGYALVMLFGRAATLLAPMVVGLSRVGFLLCTFALATLAAVVVQLLPETRFAEVLDTTEGIEEAAVEARGARYGAA